MFILDHNFDSAAIFKINSQQIAYFILNPLNPTVYAYIKFNMFGNNNLSLFLGTAGEKQRNPRNR